jgi:hypothetical protein
MLPAVEKLVKNLKPKYDDDAVDRLNYAYTSALFVFLILVIGAKQYVGEPLQCWMSAEFKNNWEKYIEHYCFVENTYYVSFENDRLPIESDREKYELKYYQWVPLFLIVQLILFLTPKSFWSAVSWKTGLNVKSLVGSHTERQKKILAKVRTDDRGDAQRSAKRIQKVLRFNQKRQGRLYGIFPSLIHTRYFTCAYLFYKLLNCLNTMTQLYIMNRFLNTSYNLWGWGILQDLIYNRDWRSSGHFPRVTYCDFMRRDDVSSLPMHFTVQCVLMINMFNEKLFIVLWFWFVALTFINIGNLFMWIFITVNESFGIQFIQAQLNFAGEKYKEKEIKTFIDNWVCLDGLTALRLVNSNAGDLVSSDIVAAMYHDYKEDEKEEERKKLAALEALKPKKQEDFLDSVVVNSNGKLAPVAPPRPNAPMDDNANEKADPANGDVKKVPLEDPKYPDLVETKSID